MKRLALTLAGLLIFAAADSDAAFAQFGPPPGGPPMGGPPRPPMGGPPRRYRFDGGRSIPRPATLVRYYSV